MTNTFPKLLLFFLVMGLSLSSCVTKKEYLSLQDELQKANRDADEAAQRASALANQLNACERDKVAMRGETNNLQTTLSLREELILDLRNQLDDLRRQRDQQASTVGDLTVLSQSANDNIKETLSQLEQKDEYIQLLQAAKSKADSINLALAVNLKSVLRDGIADEDVDVRVDKTVVFINLSDKMLYQSGSYNLTSRANEVLGKIAKIIQSRPEFEVMVEGYTDNVPINNDCITDNWDLSVKRATSVVRALQYRHDIDPNRLIAAGRGQYNALASNDTAEGRSTNRRTRIIILPKLNQFYDLLNPSNVPD
ncbi:MAG TPA: OmpA family protein [Saprospiraceae bacterium]|nr:OmpA family protein [Saprospiraceae bacterium]